jgi:hypothetical protein
VELPSGAPGHRYDVPVSTTDKASLARSGEPLEQLSKRIAERVAAERVPTVRAFAQAYTRRLSPDELADLTVDELLEQVLLSLIHHLTLPTTERV